MDTLPNVIAKKETFKKKDIEGTKKIKVSRKAHNMINVEKITDIYYMNTGRGELVSNV